MTMAILPPYSGHLTDLTSRSSSPPGYSTQPHADEETIASTPRVGPATPQGTFVREWPQATLILKDQEENAQLPTYGRHGRVIGEIGLQNVDKISRVTVKLQGHMTLSSADSGSMNTTLVSETQVLWKHQPSDNDTTQTGTEARCPSQLPLYLQFPYCYHVDGRNYRLPPSFEATFLGIPALFVRCIYTLTITITRTRSYHLASWTTNKTYVTMVNYRPRTRPSRPIVLLDTVFSSIKPVPEEWLQLVTQMQARPKSGMKGIECHLFVPSVQTFALTDTIPFHIQLCSSLQSLRELLPASSVHLQLPGQGSVTQNLRKEALGDFSTSAFTIRLSVARQVVVEVNGRKRIRTFTIGVGEMWSVPPTHHWRRDGTPSPSESEPRLRNCESLSGLGDGPDSVDGDVYLDWQGEVKCWPEVSSGGFSASNLIVKDFLVLALTPPNPRSSFLIPLQLSHPIKLVTDPWIDIDALHPGDH